MYEWLFEALPSPRTILRIRQAIERGRNKVIREHSTNASYWQGYADCQQHLIDSLKEFEGEIGYAKMEDTPHTI